MRTAKVDGAERFLPAVFVGFACFALCFQGSFYFFEYRNGDTLAPSSFKVLKDAVWTVVLSSILYVGIVRNRSGSEMLRPHNAITIGFCLWVIAVKVVEWVAYGPSMALPLAAKNMALYAAMVPALSMLSDGTKDSIVKHVLVAFVVVALAQVSFSTALLSSFPESAFWRDDPYFGFNPFVGFFSNPNRFGLFLNLAVAALCAVLVLSGARPALLAAAGLLALALGIFYTAALSQLIVYFGVLLYAMAITAVRMHWRSLRLPAIIAASVVAIGVVGLNCKGPFPDESHPEAALEWDLRNLASLALYGKTTDGAPFRFTSDSFINRVREVADLMESVGFERATAAPEPVKERTARPLYQKLFGVPEHMAPASQSQFAYLYFRYGLVGLVLFACVIAIPAARGLLALLRGSKDRRLLACHLCLVAFVATFLGDNGLLDYPTNFLFFFVLFANQWLTTDQAIAP